MPDKKGIVHTQRLPWISLLMPDPFSVIVMDVRSIFFNPLWFDFPSECRSRKENSKMGMSQTYHQHWLQETYDAKNNQWIQLPFDSPWKIKNMVLLSIMRLSILNLACKRDRMQGVSKRGRQETSPWCGDIGKQWERREGGGPVEDTAAGLKQGCVNFKISSTRCLFVY